MLSLIELILIGYFCLSVLIFVFQRKLMYHPNRNIAAPETYGLQRVEEAFTESADGTRLQLWKCPSQLGYPTIIYFHGNAIHLADRAAKFSAFTDSGFGLVAISYRGFGKSEGSPSEIGIYDDARAAIDYAIKHFNLTDSRMVYFGESLGSGVAVQMATEHAPALVMLEAAYTSVETRSAELYPFIFGVRYMVLDKYNSLSKINNVRAPLVMIHGVKDEVIPLHHGRQLFEAANDPKELIVYDEVHHADYSNEQILVPLIKAARKFGLIKETSGQP